LKPPRASPLGRLAIALLRPLLRRWVDVQGVGAEALAARLDRGTPVCWALQFRSLTSLVVLDEQVRRLGLPLPLAPLAAAGADGTRVAAESHAFFFLTRDGQPSPLAARPYAYAPRLGRLVAAVRADPSADVTIVPVHVFWGRAPRNQDSVLKALLSEGWAIPGALRQLARVLVHGRQTMMEFGEPMSLRAMVDGADDDAHAVRRAARLLRGQFRRVRERVVGPDLSHRHTLINAVIAGEPVQAAIDEAARARAPGRAGATGRERAEASARRAAWEIASNYSYPFIRAFDLGLQLLWNRLYDGISASRLDELRRIASDATVVYVPCHRSHIDYLLLSFLIYYQGLPPPHVAAGANLNLPVVGGLLRRGGAFFLRRSFRGDALYAAVFAEYLHAMIVRGFPVEYFVEGGRSRTGRTLSPKAGLLAMTVESWLRAPVRPLVFVPVYIGYERLLEGDAYVAELSGRPKQKESLLGLLRSLRRLREHFGRVHVNVGEPIPLGAFMAERGVLPPPHAGATAPAGGAAVSGDAAAAGDAVGAARGGRTAAAAAKADATRRAAIDALALEIVTRINDAVVVNPVNLVSVAMLGSPRHAMDAAQLVRHLDLLRELLARAPYSSRLVVSPLSGAEIVEQAERTGLLWRIAHPLGDVLQVHGTQVALLAYFRNNVLHAWALPALLATLLSQHPGIERERLLAIAARVFPFLRAELFLSWDADALGAKVDACLEAFEALGLLGRSPGARDSAALHALAQLMRQPLERWFIVLSVLTGQGSGALSPKSLEDLCFLLAQRMTFLHEPGSPEFFDRASFRSIVATLVALGWARSVEGRLVFDGGLVEAAGDAPWLLSDEVRRAIAQVTRLSDEDVRRAETLFAPARPRGRGDGP
jgi:glycerol-3-phosphate O-acyltransferase